MMMRWASWAVGGKEDARQMLAELSGKRRLLLVEWGKSKKNRESRWLATENLGLLLAAREGEAMDLKRLAGGKLVPVDHAEIPAALLVTSITPEEARRLLVEQTIKREPVTTAAAVVKELSWMAKSVPALIDELQNEGFVQELAPVTPDGEPRSVCPNTTSCTFRFAEHSVVSFDQGRSGRAQVVFPAFSGKHVEP